VCPDVLVRYDAAGSGAGIARFVAGEVAFAGSDSALSAAKGETDAAAARCGGGPAWNLPMVTGPIAVAYNLGTVGRLVLDAPTTARIFRGEIRTWDDPAIAALNPDELLPPDEIQVLFRADESGTTENFTKYLAAAGDGAWPDAPGKTWPVEGVGEGREKSAGVAEAVATTPGSLTYVEWSYAKENRLGVAQIDTGAGPVELTTTTAAATVATAERTGTGDDLTLALDHATREPGAYPIVLVTYEVVCSAGLEPGTAAGVAAFLRHMASPEVQASLVDIGYAPLPASVQRDVLAAIDALA
jgi:phosphate transport system substrate-binding protein